MRTTRLFTTTTHGPLGRSDFLLNISVYTNIVYTHTRFHNNRRPVKRYAKRPPQNSEPSDKNSETTLNTHSDTTMIKGKNRLICSQVADEWSQYLPDATVSGIPQNIIPTCQHPRLESSPQSAEREGARVMSSSWHVHGNEDETPTDVADGLYINFASEYTHT